jgi:hypothetical protein
MFGLHCNVTAHLTSLWIVQQLPTFGTPNCLVEGSFCPTNVMNRLLSNPRRRRGQNRVCPLVIVDLTKELLQALQLLRWNLNSSELVRPGVVEDLTVSAQIAFVRGEWVFVSHRPRQLVYVKLGGIRDVERIVLVGCVRKKHWLLAGLAFQRVVAFLAEGARPKQE